ncbi:MULTISPECIES: transposase [unclassified Janthinobacterium]|uniref:transposase n=1 Tax=unclassified Janthinobacterium TaxID=2610881 RepID=UPI0020C89A90|nr:MULTISPECIES: transposase [unclassified Janthinobacterium]
MGTILGSGVEHGRRRRSTNYPLEFKRKLAHQACEPRGSVAQLALQHDLNTNMLCKWRRQLRAGLSDQPGLVAVTLTPTVPARHLLDRCNLEFLCVPLTAHIFSSCSTWLKSVYDSRGDSKQMG